MPAKLSSRLPEIAASMRPRVSQGVKRGAEKIADTARRNLESNGSVRTGDLINKINVVNAGPAEWKVVAGDSTTFYAHMVEGGTDIAPPKPFLIPAMEEEQHEVAVEVQNVLRLL